MAGNLLLIHGGGPTAVMNASLHGAILQAQSQPEIQGIYGALGGMRGFLEEKLADLRRLSGQELERLAATPGSLIGTSLDILSADDYQVMARLAQRHGIGYILCSGGNGTMDACGKLFDACRALGLEVCVIGIPKTMANDLAMTDHSPGYGSAARYLAGSVAELCADAQGMPTQIVVVEALGRSTGWVAAASALAEDCGVDGPDLIYLPEVDFSEEAFLEDVGQLIARKGSGVIVASEGLHLADGTPVAEPVFQAGRAAYFGDVSAQLAGLITQRLGLPARAEKPGRLGRASIAWQSQTDREEAFLAGKAAVRAAVRGESGKMVAFERMGTSPYRIRPYLVDLRRVMAYEKTVPIHFINERRNGVTDAFKAWCRPLLGAPMPRMLSPRACQQVLV